MQLDIVLSDKFNEKLATADLEWVWIRMEKINIFRKLTNQIDSTQWKK